MQFTQGFKSEEDPTLLTTRQKLMSENLASDQLAFRECIPFASKRSWIQFLILKRMKIRDFISSINWRLLKGPLWRQQRNSDQKLLCKVRDYPSQSFSYGYSETTPKLRFYRNIFTPYIDFPTSIYGIVPPLSQQHPNNDFTEIDYCEPCKGNILFHTSFENDDFIYLKKWQLPWNDKYCADSKKWRDWEVLRY